MIGAGRQQVREALQDLRQTVGRLREPVEVELSLPKALQRLTASFQEATGLTIHLELPENACEVSSTQRLALYRTAQEGLTNVQRHAAAHEAWLHLECSLGQIRLQVADDGCGLGGNASTSGFGLRGLQERAAQLGGAVTISDRPDGGTILTIQLPVQER
jgi:signal transduction histidine kinase